MVGTQQLSKEKEALRARLLKTATSLARPPPAASFHFARSHNGGATVLHFVAAIAPKTWLLHSVPLRRSLASQGGSMVFCETCLQTPCPCRGTYLRARGLFNGSLAENHGSLRSQSRLAPLAAWAAGIRSPPDLLQWGAAHSINRATIHLWRPGQCFLLDKRPGFGIIYHVVLSQGLLCEGPQIPTNSEAPFIGRRSPTFLEAFACRTKNFPFCPKWDTILRTDLNPSPSMS